MITAFGPFKQKGEKSKDENGEKVIFLEFPFKISSIT
jgi:hypothetical protein